MPFAPSAVNNQQSSNAIPTVILGTAQPVSKVGGWICVTVLLPATVRVRIFVVQVVIIVVVIFISVLSLLLMREILFSLSLLSVLSLSIII